MDKIELLGGACFSHGPYTFYKAVRIGSNRVLRLGSFFLTKLWSDADLVSIGELQLLWIDSRGPNTPLASLRLYFLPENTPDGRRDTHGEDEVLSIQEKVVVRVHDLVTWLSPSLEWSWGREVSYPPTPASSPESSPQPQVLSDPGLDFSDVERHQKDLEAVSTRHRGSAAVNSDNCPAPGQTKVVVLSYARYCRYRALLRRLEGSEPRWLCSSIAAALGGFTALPGTRVLFCRDTFDYPDLETHELLCNHLAPKLKGRPRRKRKKRSLSPAGESSNESEASVASSAAASTSKGSSSGQSNASSTTSTSAPATPAKSTTAAEPQRKLERKPSAEEKKFVSDVHSFMTSRNTPLGKMPLLGYRQIDLFLFYTKVQDMGGYDKVSANRLWKSIYDEMGGNTGSTSAATITRRHYERLLLPYERCQKGEESRAKPLPVAAAAAAAAGRRIKSSSMSETSEDSVEVKREAESPQPAETPPPSSEAAMAGTTAEAAPLQQSVLAASVPPSCSPSGVMPVNTVTSNASAVVTLTPPPEKDMKEIKLEAKPTSLHPAQGKENIPLSSEDKPLVGPRSSPEVIDLETETDPATRDKLIIPSFKKRKLEILRKGGLEVTALETDSRPSVIQPTTMTTATTISMTTTTTTTTTTRTTSSTATTTSSTAVATTTTTTTSSTTSSSTAATAVPTSTPTPTPLPATPPTSSTTDPSPSTTPVSAAISTSSPTKSEDKSPGFAPPPPPPPVVIPKLINVTVTPDIGHMLPRADEPGSARQYPQPPTTPVKQQQQQQLPSASAPPTNGSSPPGQPSPYNHQQHHLSPQQPASSRVINLGGASNASLIQLYANANVPMPHAAPGVPSQLPPHMPTTHTAPQHRFPATHALTAQASLSNGRLVLPKVTQSKSIFASTGEKTVYGNPKDIMQIPKYMPTTMPQPHILSSPSVFSAPSISPRYPSNDLPPSGVLDLTQKPNNGAINNERASSSSSSSSASSSYGRSNLEIVKVPVVPRPTPLNLETHHRGSGGGVPSVKDVIAKPAVSSVEQRKNSYMSGLPAVPPPSTAAVPPGYPNVLDSRTMASNNLEITLVSPKKIVGNMTVPSQLSPPLARSNNVIPSPGMPIPRRQLPPAQPQPPLQPQPLTAQQQQQHHHHHHHHLNGKYPSRLPAEPTSPYTPRKPTSSSNNSGNIHHPVIPNVPNLSHLGASYGKSSQVVGGSNYQQQQQQLVMEQKRKAEVVAVANSRAEQQRRISEGDKVALQQAQHQRLEDAKHQQQSRDAEARRHSVPSLPSGYMSAIPPTANPAFLAHQLAASSNNAAGKFFPLLDPSYFPFYNGLFHQTLPPSGTAPAVYPRDQAEIDAYYKDLYARSRASVEAHQNRMFTLAAQLPPLPQHQPQPSVPTSK